jgi:hypothetical protein
MPRRRTDNLLEGDWSVARPGEPANLPSAEEVLTGGWRTSSEPITVVTQASAIAKPDAPVVRQAQHVEDGNENKPAPAYKPPTWSPDRPSESALLSEIGEPRDTGLRKRPAWSATR